MTRNLVVTGAGGLVGTALTAALLPAFDRVLLLTAGQPDLPKLRRRIGRVLKATAAPAHLPERVTALPLDALTPAALRAAGLGTVAQVWNVGASLSYDQDRLAATVAANTAVPLRLLEVCAPTERFFHISTVGVTGPGSPARRDTITEAPVWRPDAVNPYVASKLLTEHMLDNLRARTGAPVSMLRLGSVLGPAGHPPVQDNRAGYFTLVEMLAKVTARRAVLTIDAEPGNAPPLAHVDQLAASCAALADRAGRGDDLAAYYHLGDQTLTNAAAADAVNAALGQRVLRLGPPRTALDRAYASVNADNVAFMSCGFRFDHAVLDAHVPAGARPRVDADSYARFVTGQLARLAARRTARRDTGAAA
ncbi:NAD-dependent epimerase/dehydratase family protein [Streptomyces sp. XM83C]|uniref:NAD-dependent epimerase/dehydratase family protein n=1 Tax=unclassified Streptomyces TaxID=2593676 RepID=UPI001FFAD194|nr:NAD-dependent epimerase/dehydratase family protein [Streptomyces sp. XM83C]MCK1821563.1 NAD-dependent epimerase/dehydratase family protein [Streptomyces sp. XM83C]